MANSARFLLSALLFGTVTQLPAAYAQAAPAAPPAAAAPSAPAPMHAHGMNDGASDWAKQKLNASPRHHEYVTLKREGRNVEAFVAYPEAKGKTPVVILIHEIFGLSDWAKEMADELAGAGYIVVAPDLLSQTGAKGGGTGDYASQDDAVKGVSKLNPDQVMADLDAAAEFAKKIPAANGKLFVAGFCWGGGKTFAFAAHRKDLAGAMVFYGPPPPVDSMKNIAAPVYGFYAGNDARISATVPDTQAAMKAAGKVYEPVTYDGAGHGFMRAGEAPDASAENAAARTAGFHRLIDLLGGVH